MTTTQIDELFEKHEEESHKFERITNKLATRADIHAFILLDRLFPSDNGADIISCAEHDQIWISIETERLETLTEDNIVELMRCGVWWESQFDSLSMFV